MEINYVCSLGSFCHTAGYLKNYKLRYCSYPFDNIISSPEVVCDCLSDDFKLFLDKSRYEIVDVWDGSKTTNHKLYGKFAHSYGMNHTKSYNTTFAHNNLFVEEEYKYFIRKVERFRILLNKSESKLFLLFSQDEDYTKKQIDELNDILKTKTTNYEICCITFHNDYTTHYDIEEHDNYKLLKVYMYSRSDGAIMTCPSENDYLDSIIKKYYNFNLKDDIKLG
jgi:hypothetical protein